MGNLSQRSGIHDRTIRDIVFVVPPLRQISMRALRTMPQCPSTQDIYFALKLTRACAPALIIISASSSIVIESALVPPSSSPYTCLKQV